MNVLIISYMYPSPFKYYSGIFVHEQVKALKQCGCNVTVISPRPFVPFPFYYFSKRLRIYHRIPFRTVIDGIVVYRPQYYALPGIIFVHFFRNIFFHRIKNQFLDKNNKFSFDIIHGHTIYDGYIAYKIGRHFNKLSICTIHGGDVNSLDKMRKEIQKMTLFVISKINGLIVVSNDLNSKISALISKRLNIDVIPNGVDISKFNIVERNKARQILNLELNAKIILFVGELTEPKGIFVLLDALKIINKEILK